MSYPHLVDQKIDKNNPDFADFPDSIDGQIYVDGDAQTGWKVHPDWTPEQLAELQEKADDRQDADQIRAEPTVRSLITARPAQIENYIDNNVTDLASAKAVLKILAKAVSAIGKRQFRG